MALWELTTIVNHEAVNCDFCGTENLDTWYADNDNYKNACLPCVWKRNEGECDKCESTYELSDRTNRCGECGNCNNCCTHERESA